MIAIDNQRIHEIARFTPIKDRKSGLSCQFIRIDENWGMKFYQDENMRDKTWNLQSLAAKEGLAPRVGQCFELQIPFKKDNKPTEVFGYITECISETYGDRLANNLFGISRNECDSKQSNELYRCMYSEYEYDQLISGIKNLGITTNDIHIMNVGYLGDTLVCIDFSEEKEI